MKNYKTVVVKKIDQNLIQQWKKLWEQGENANPFNSYEWFLTCLEINNNTDYALYVCFEADQLVAILPLYSYKVFGIKVLGTINSHYLIDSAFLVRSYDKELLKHFFTLILQRENIFLQKAESRVVHILHDIFPDLFISLMSINPTVSLGNDPFQKTSPSTIKQIQKIIRKNPDLRFVMYDNNFKTHLQTMFTLEGKSSKKEQAMDIFSKSEIRKFYLTRIKHSDSIIRICFLYLNKTPIAYQYGYLYNNYFVCDQIAYRSEYAKLRPGKSILYFLFEELKKDGVQTVDLGGGISTYKSEFTDEYRLLYNIYYSKNAFVLSWWKLINKIRRQKQLLFPKKNTRDHEFLFKTL